MVAAAAPVRTRSESANTGESHNFHGSVTTGYSVANTPITLEYNPPIATSNFWDYFMARHWNLGCRLYFRLRGGETITIEGISFSISGTPNAGDRFTISQNSGNDEKVKKISTDVYDLTESIKKDILIIKHLIPKF